MCVGPDWNVSATIKVIAMNFVRDSHCTQRMDPGDTDPLMFAVAHPACWILHPIDILAHHFGDNNGDWTMNRTDDISQGHDGVDSF